MRLLALLVIHKYTLLCKAAVLCDHGKGCRGRHHHNILCKCPLAARVGTGPCRKP